MNEQHLFRSQHSGLKESIDGKEFNFINNPTEILKELMLSKENGNAIGINAPNISESIFITSVEDIILEEADILVVTKPYDSTGYMLPSNQIFLKDISSICVLKSAVKNPYLDNVEKDKKWFF